MRSFRKMGKKIYFLGETTINAGEHFREEGTNTAVSSSKAPKAGKLIVGHLGSSTGFVDNGLLMFKAKKSNRHFHSEINSDIFMKWMETVFPKLEPNCVIVVDSAPHHTTILDPVPTSEWLRRDIEKWLIQNDGYFENDYRKLELIDVVKAINKRGVQYVFDVRCKELGFSVLRLPPHYWSLNAMEMVWDQIKKHVCLNNKTYSLAEVEKLTREAVAMVTSNQWNDYVSRVMKDESDFWKLQDILEETLSDYDVATTDIDSSDSDFSDDQSDILEENDDSVSSD